MKKAKDADLAPAFCSTAGAARFLDLSPRSVMRLRAQGVLRTVKMGGSVKIALADLEAYAAALLKAAELQVKQKKQPA